MNEKKIIEAALFISTKPIAVQKLAQLAETDEDRAASMVRNLKKELEDRDSALRISELEDENFVMELSPELLPKVSELTPVKDLHRGTLKTLSLILYKEPILQSDMVKLRGNRIYDQVRELAEKNLVKAVKKGRSKVLCTTARIEQYFGMPKDEIRKKIAEKIDECNTPKDAGSE